MDYRQTNQSRRISAGELRHRLQFQRHSTVENENGVPISTWATAYTVWGAARDVSGKEFFEAAAHKMEDVVTFTVRTRGDVDTAMRIIFRDKAFEIIAINNLDYRGDYMQIKARRIGGEGA